MQQMTDEGRAAAQRAAEHAQAAASSAGLAAGAAAEALTVAATVAAGVAAERGREVVQVVRERAENLPTPEVLEGVLEEAYERGAEAWDALRGRRTPPPRRWPWATGTALAGALVAVAATVVMRRLATQDAPGAQEPEQVQAVVDLAPAGPAARPVDAVDEDGEAVRPA